MTAQDRKTARRRRRLLPALLAVYLLILALIVFWPTPVDEGASGAIHRVLSWLDERGMPLWAGYGLLEISANVVLFVPFGILIAAFLPLRRAWLALPAGIFASIFIEVGQNLFRPERFATVQDVLANSLGAAVGTVIVYGWTLRHGDQTARR